MHVAKDHHSAFPPETAHVVFFVTDRGAFKSSICAAQWELQNGTIGLEWPNKLHRGAQSGPIGIMQGGLQRILAVGAIEQPSVRPLFGACEPKWGVICTWRSQKPPINLLSRKTKDHY